MQLTPTRTIEGNVTDATTGSPAVNVPVHVGTFTSGFPSFYTEDNAARTDASGHYLLQGVFSNIPNFVWAGNEGIYFCQYYQASSTGCAFFGPPNSPSVVLGDSEHRSGVDFALQTGAYVSGKVYDPDTGWTPNLIAISLASASSGVVAAQARTAADGTFVTTAVIPGDYYLEAWDPPLGAQMIYPNCAGCQPSPELALHLSAAQQYGSFQFAIPHLDLIFRGAFEP